MNLRSVLIVLVILMLSGVAYSTIPIPESTDTLNIHLSTFSTNPMSVFMVCVAIAFSFAGIIITKSIKGICLGIPPLYLAVAFGLSGISTIAVGYTVMSMFALWK